MLNSYVPFCILILLVGTVLKVYIPWWMWVFAIASDCFNINETREWRREERKHREEQDKVDRIVRESLAPKK
jgi:hypothetical protein